MNLDFEELDYRQTPLGELILRRRAEPRLDGLEIFEIKLGEEFLMSSLVTAGEVALARLGLAALKHPGRGAEGVDVVVGGLGLGYTAAAVLEHDFVHSLLVVDFLGEVIEWHRKGLVPLGPGLTADDRCRLVNGDFFAAAADPEQGFDHETPGRRFDAILLDIDHSPGHLLHPRNAAFYSADGLSRLAQQLRPGGVFALWSNDPADEAFTGRMKAVFPVCDAHRVTFENPYTREESACTVYVARRD